MKSILDVIIPYFNHTNARVNRRLLEESLDRLSLNQQCRVIISEGVWNTESELPDFSERVHRHLKYRYSQALWVKENLINLALRDCGFDWKFAAWIDKDIEFLDPDWACRTIEALENHDIIQPWSRAVCSGAPGKGRNIREYLHLYQGRLLNDDEGMMSWATNPNGIDGKEGHCGFAWAATKDFLDRIGGLYDRCLLGGGDDYLKASLLGEGTKIYKNSGLSAIGQDRRFEIGVARFYGDFKAVFQKRCRGSRIGFVEGTIIHHYHGGLAARGYLSRYECAAHAGFDGERDVIYGGDGTIRLLNESLAESISEYFPSRWEHLVV
jgi:hypothetical protein